MVRLAKWLMLGLWLIAAADAQDTRLPEAIRIFPKDNVELQSDRDRGPKAGSDPQNAIGWPLLKHLGSDEESFWMGWRNLDRDGAVQLSFFAGFTGLLVASDHWLTQQLPASPAALNRSNQVSQFATYSLLGAAGSAFLWGRLTRNDHLREAGFLSGEAALDSMAAAYAFKAVTQRQRPLEGNNSGQFFQGGSSFPSEHSAIAWSVASVVAHEYPGPLTKILAYGLASTVTLTRVTGKQHFSSDAFVGTALGWYLGRQVYRARRDPELGGGAWDGLLEPTADAALKAGGETVRDPKKMASSYVPLDSWVYPALERLAALGYVQSAYLGMRPWTRMECARLLDEIEDGVGNDGELPGDVQNLQRSLGREFFAETERLGGAANLGMRVESIYTRATGIAGTPLNDGYHFGQTIIDDLGRPYGAGMSSIGGFTADAVAGRLAFSLQAEYQSAAGVPSASPQALEAIATIDAAQVLADGRPLSNRIELLDSTVALKLVGDLQVSFGKQSLWLGPGESGPLLFSDNAPPVEMLRLDNVSPYRVPLVSRLLGPVRSEFFLGQLTGQHWVFSPPTLYGPVIRQQPFLHGSKISFKPTPNLELGFGFTAMFAGPGLPFTWGNFLRTFYQHRANTVNNPGKRLSAFDLTYRVPGLRKWLEFYLDSMVIDEYSPLGSSRPSLNPGIYLPRIPKVRKLDFRLEGVATDIPTMHFNVGAVYSDSRYHSGYTNAGMLMGTWIGRMGRGEQGWATYWFSARSKLQAGYRQQDVNRVFLEGGHLQDFRVRSEVALRPDLGISASLQYEKWRFPLLAALPQRNLTSTIQLTWWPVRGKKP